MYLCSSEKYVRSAPWTVQLYEIQTQENIINIGVKNKIKKEEENKMCNKIKCAGQYTVDLINNNISRNVLIQGIYIAAIWTVEINEYLTDY